MPYRTVVQFCDNHTAFTQGGMRSLIFNENSNSGAIVRLGRKVLINDERFFVWLEEQNVNGRVVGG